MSDDENAGLLDQANKLLNELNQSYALVQTDSRVSILDLSKKSGAGFRLLSRGDFSTLLSNRMAPGASKQNAAVWWLGHPKRRQYDGIVFAPEEPETTEYNIWQGFAIEPAPGNCVLFWKFVMDVICNGNKEHYDYVRSWLAHLIQKPGELPEAALVLRGKQGTGKTTFTDLIGRLVGEAHYMTVTDMQQVTGRFNGHLANVLLLNANEAIWGGNKQAEGSLKAMITDTKIAVEYKGQDAITVNNYKRLIVCTNNSWPIAMDADDRRFLVIDVSDCHKNDTEYFAALRAQLADGGYQALMKCLLEEDISQFNPRRLPRSTASLDIKLKSGGALMRWLYGCLESGSNRRLSDYANPSASDTTAWRQEVPKAAVYEGYLNFCREQHEKHPEANYQFHKLLWEMLPDAKGTRPTVGGERIRTMVFPSLADCRLQFERHLKMEGCIPWPEVT